MPWSFIFRPVGGRLESDTPTPLERDRGVGEAKLRFDMADATVFYTKGLERPLAQDRRGARPAA